MERIRFCGVQREHVIGFVGGVALTLTGVAVRGWWLDSHQRVPFDPLVLFGDGYRVERVGEREFRFSDTRGEGNALRADNMPHLNEVVRVFQDHFRCNVLGTGQRGNDLVVRVENPGCFFEAREKMQQGE